MKYLVVVCALIIVVQGKVLPERLSKLLCRKFDPQYEQCVKRNIEKVIPHLIKGIPEFNLPSIDPLEIPEMSVDRTINELVSIKAVMKNIKVTGCSNVVIEHIRANPQNYTGEVRLMFPWTRLEMDYDVNGQLLAVPLQSKGHFIGNFTNTQLFKKGNLKTFDKNGVKHFKVDKTTMKIRVGDGEIKLTADDPELQLGADVIADFYNENPRLVMDAINPIFVETAVELYRIVVDYGLSLVPAKEWLPE